VTSARTSTHASSAQTFFVGRTAASLRGTALLKRLLRNNEPGTRVTGPFAISDLTCEFQREAWGFWVF
jgi:hypothetical protein